MPIDPPCGFSKNAFFRVSLKACFSVTFNIVISHIFPKTFIEVPQVVQKIWRFSSSILAIFIIFFGFFDVSLLQENNDVSMTKNFLSNRWLKNFFRPIIVNYSFIVTHPHRKNLPQNAAWKLIIWSRMEKKIFSNYCKKYRFQECKTRQII